MSRPTPLPGRRQRLARARASVVERSVDLAFATGWRVVRALPERPVLWVANRLADRAVRRGGPGIEQLRRNLRRVAGPLAPRQELDRLVRDGARSYARYWVETFRLPSMPAQSITPRVEVRGLEHVFAADRAGKGAILALPHMGNWDVAGIFLIGQGIPFTTVAERLKPDSLFRRFVAYREQLGFEVLPLTGGPPTAPLLAARLEQGRTICLVGDRALGSGGVDVQLFGEAAVLPAGPAMLAARTGAALLAVGIWFTDDGWGIEVSPPLEAPAGGLAQRTRDLTRALAAQFEAQIAAHPADWHMLQPIWSADRDAARRRRRAVEAPGASDPASSTAAGSSDNASDDAGDRAS